MPLVTSTLGFPEKKQISLGNSEEAAAEVTPD